MAWNDLSDNGGGVCTDCHAGRNPFSVHPDDPAFISLKSAGIGLDPLRRYEPIVPRSKEAGYLPWPESNEELQAGEEVHVVQILRACNSQAYRVTVQQGKGL